MSLFQESKYSYTAVAALYSDEKLTSLALLDDPLPQGNMIKVPPSQVSSDTSKLVQVTHGDHRVKPVKMASYISLGHIERQIRQ